MWHEQFLKFSDGTKITKKLEVANNATSENKESAN